MAEKLWNKGNISFMPVVESINRKFALRREKTGVTVIGKKHLGGFQFMGAGTRTQLVAGRGIVSKNYFWMRKYGRASAASADEIAARTQFGECSQWVAAARKDLQVIAANNAKWKAAVADFSLTIEGVSAAGYNPIGWMFAVCYAYYKNHSEVPSTHALPAFDA